MSTLGRLENDYNCADARTVAKFVLITGYANRAEQLSGVAMFCLPGLLYRRRSVLVCGLLLCCGWGLVGCSVQSQPPTTAAAAPLPELGTGREIEPGVMLHEITLPRKGDSTAVWIYLPKDAGPKKLGCVLIAPAGTPCVHGIKLGEGDRPEHLPYVRAGFVVVAYELSGSVGDKTDNASAFRAIKAFADAGAGVRDAGAAIDFALARVPQVDPQRIYAVGHSSAGSVALLVAEQEPYINACVAFAPRTFLAEALGEPAIHEISRGLPDFRQMVSEASPSTRAPSLTCPLLLVHAEDDNVVPIRESVQFVERLSQTNKKVTFVRVSKGGHYTTMTDIGIPRAIDWLKGL